MTACYWQRFIAIPLQAQGKQGGIVLDFENQVLGRQDARVRAVRAVPPGRLARPPALPADESPTAWSRSTASSASPGATGGSSTEMTRRTGRVAYAQAADAIADLLDDPATDRQVETLQDRIHRLYAWWLIDKDHGSQARIKAEADALLTLQNPDGGWHEARPQTRTRAPSTRPAS